jgi:hypothetical protein
VCWSASQLAQVTGRPNIRTKGAQRLGVIGPQQPRRGRVAEGIALKLEHTVSRQKA